MIRFMKAICGGLVASCVLGLSGGAAAIAATVDYSVTFEFTNPTLDVTGDLILNTGSLPSTGTLSGSQLNGVISSFSVTFPQSVSGTQTSDTFSCSGNGCTAFFSSLVFSNGNLSQIQYFDNQGTGNGTVSNTLQIGNSAFTSAGTDFSLNPPGQENTSNGIVITAVPEVSTWAMMILGFLGVGCAVHFRRDKQFRFA